ncbi:MAG: cysteine desulfurase [Anaerolineae bacterium]|nr:cysteine desulfurase [Anaerolineae bacterium]
MSEKIYLDYAATTPVDSRVLDVMLPYFTQDFGNPSSVHRYGQKAEAALDEARATVARILNCKASEIVFTSCGTESNNLAIRGAAMAAREKRGANQILTTRVEHTAVTKTVEQLEKYYGFQVKWLDIDETGMVLPKTVAAAIDQKTALVTVMYANNEIGTLNPVSEIAKICGAKNVLFHTDALQATGYFPMDVESLGIDLMSLGCHKFYGPKGVGVLYVRAGTQLISHQTGGGQEDGLRAGTQNIPYIVGFAEALRLTDMEREARVSHLGPLRDRIIGTVLKEVPDAQLTGHPVERLPNHASFAFKGVDGNTLTQLLDAAGFACSSGSACKTGNPEPSGVMTAIGLTPDWGLGSLRVTLGAHSTSEQVDSFLTVLPELVDKTRKLTGDKQG